MHQQYIKCLLFRRVKYAVK